MRGTEKPQLSDCCQLSLCFSNGGGGVDNLAHNQPLMPLKCQRLQKERETAKLGAHSYFSMADAIIRSCLTVRTNKDPRSLKKQKTNKQNREGRHDKREMKKRKRDFVEVMEAAPSNGCLYSTKFGVDLSHSFSLSLRR